MAKHQIARFGVSLSRSLLNELDRMVQQKGYKNRSLAISDMVRDHLIEHRQQTTDSEVAGTITLVYNHHRPHVQETLTNLQHKQRATINSSLHVHLDHDNCLEVLVVRGRASAVRSVADHLIAVRGVKHGKLTLTTTGKDLPE
jgi:CopG family transcriptional regulator, nickel-responsive regulator